MKHKIVLTLLVVALTVTAGLHQGDPASAQDGVGQYAPINGLELYYEVHGTGQPLILLHGGLGTIDMLFGQLLPALAANRQVIAVELQGHGHTADIDRPFAFGQFADDIAALIAYLGLEQADIMGFSLGGGVALQTAIRHPEVVRSLIIVSAPYSNEGWYPEVQAGMAAMNAEVAAAMTESPLYSFYAEVAPRPEDWATLVVKTGKLTSQPYNWADEVATIQAPALLIAGDADNVRPSHMVAMFELLGGAQADGFTGGLPNSQLAILPATTHFDILMKTDLLMPLINPFLDGSAE